MPAPGEHSLTTLLRSLKTTISSQTFIFLTIPHASFEKSIKEVPISKIQMLFHEQEGTTLILDTSTANQYFPPDQYEYTFECRMVTLDVHSSLEAVGFLKVISERLTREGITTNPVAGFYHDHLFLPVDKVDEAVRCLEELREEALKAETWSTCR
ncbi:hypothetical protein H2198_003349 [Neophaeococcomyces mojaviensis]|uniref:Uncharacterized protein n=1 Tax=Neophaeococcomyces mojaviensis TaxID=3383035 RepID=A0ACC3ABK4_9EURO|nr:hypothetical protein H2198_003349 [Knufia sp. JES_112]